MLLRPLARSPRPSICAGLSCLLVRYGRRATRATPGSALPALPALALPPLAVPWLCGPPAWRTPGQRTRAVANPTGGFVAATRHPAPLAHGVTWKPALVAHAIPAHAPQHIALHGAPKRKYSMPRVDACDTLTCPSMQMCPRSSRCGTTTSASESIIYSV